MRKIRPVPSDFLSGRQTSIRRKFLLIPITSAICIVAVGGIGLAGLAATVSETQRIYQDNVRTGQLTTSLQASPDDAGETALRLPHQR
jgi:hypothetical protein